MEIVNDACMHMMLCAFVFVQNVISRAWTETDAMTCSDTVMRDPSVTVYIATMLLYTQRL